MDRLIKNYFIFSLILLVLFVISVSLLHPFVKSSDETYYCLSCDELDFHRWTTDSSPVMSFFIQNHDEKLMETMTYSAGWINVSEISYYNHLKEIIVSLDVSDLSPGLYREKIEFMSDDNRYVLPIRLDLVKSKTIVQLTYSNPTIMVNGQPTLLLASPFAYKDLTFVPLRAICEAFGATVSFKKEEDNKVICITYQDQVIELPFNNDYMVINGEKNNIAERIQIRNSTAFFPIEYVRKIFQFSIQFNSQCRLITLVY